MEQLYTRWGRELNSEHVLQEYPRPLLRRKSYVNLNGYWDYAFTKKFRKPETYDGKILVPFSPESVLSGVSRQLQPEEYLWYRQTLSVDTEKLRSGFRLILHFGAVDQVCRVYVNGREAGRHTGGYLPFSVDITTYCVEKNDEGPETRKSFAESGDCAVSENELTLVVRDLSDTSYHARGKQKLKRGGMFYTAQSGIWQTVWMEYVPAHYVKELLTEPLLAMRPEPAGTGMMCPEPAGTGMMRPEPAGAEMMQTEPVRKVPRPDAACGSVRITVCADADMPVRIQIREPAMHRENDSAEGTRPEGSGSFTEGICPEGDGSFIEGLCAEKSSSFTEGLRAEEGGSSGRMVIAETCGFANRELEIPLPVVRPWTCETPYLYDVTVTMGEDTVVSYFALRTFSVQKDEKGIPRICLNGQVQFQNGVLDQGYWPDGLYTAPSDAAYIFDITEMKKMGFNMLRKHVKIEPQRWYYHCDRLGMIVWQDMVNGGSYYKHWFVTYAATLFSRKRWNLRDTCLTLLARADGKGRREFIREMKETIRLLKGHPSIAAWVIFNEGWGQFHAGKMTELARACDDSRLIDQASGWFDQNGGDMQSIHHYFFRFKFLPEKERATVLSEYGGYSFRVPGHSACKKLYGYGIHQNGESLNTAYHERMRSMKAQIPEGLCAGVYTQLSDVEEEVNGIFTYDREVKKIV